MKLFAGAEADNAKAATRLASDMGEFFMPFPGTRINQQSATLTAGDMPGAASSYEVKFTDTTKPNGQIWAGVVGNATTTVAPGQPLTPRGQRNERWFVVWLGTANHPVDKAAAVTLAQSIRPWSPPPPPVPEPNAVPAPADPNAPPPDPNAPPARPPVESASRSTRLMRQGCCPRPDDEARSSACCDLVRVRFGCRIVTLRGYTGEWPSAALGGDRQEIARWMPLQRPSCSLGQRH